MDLEEANSQGLAGRRASSRKPSGVCRRSGWPTKAAAEAAFDERATLGNNEKAANWFARAVRHGPPAHDSIERLPLEQDRARHGSKAGRGAQRSWRLPRSYHRSHAHLPKLILKFSDGLEVAAEPRRQPKPPPPNWPGRHQDLAIAPQASPLALGHGGPEEKSAI